MPPANPRRRRPRGVRPALGSKDPNADWCHSGRSRRVRGAARAAIVIFSLASAVACGDGVTGPDIGEPGLRVVAGADVADSVESLLPRPLVIELRNETGRLMPGGAVEIRTAVVTSAACEGGVCPVVSIADSAGAWYGPQQRLQADRSGRVQVFVRLGRVAGTATVRITAPILGYETTASFTVRPGALSQVVVGAGDTAAYVGHSYALRAAAADRLGNRRDDPLAFATQSAVALVSSDGVVTAARVGRGSILVTSGGRTATAWVTVPPEGTLAAFDVGAGYGASVGLVRVELDGSGYRVLAPFTYDSYYGVTPAWTPSGVVLYQSGGYYDTRVMAVDDAGISRPLLWEGRTIQELYARVSADGRYVFYNGRDGSCTAIWRADTDGSDAQPLGSAAGACEIWQGAQPAPSPDGSRVAYSGASGLTVWTAGGGAPVPLGVTGTTRAAWSPLGDRIAFLKGGAVWVIAPDGSGLRRLSADGTTHQLTLDWSPDGRWVVTRGTRTLDLLDVESGATLPLPFSGSLVEVSWKP